MKSAEIALLSLLSEKPRHAYGIEQVIEARGMRNWTEIGFSSIYYLLNKLQAAELIESRMEHPRGPGPARKVYNILPEGEAALRDGVLQALSEPGQYHPALLLGIANLPLVSRSEAVKALEQYLEALDKRRAEMVKSWNREQRLPFHVEKLFLYSDTLLQAERNWIENLVAELEEKDVEG